MADKRTQVKTSNSIGDLKLIGRLLLYLRPYRRQIAGSVLLFAVISLLSLAGPYFVKIAIDECIMKGDYARLDLIIAAYFAVLLLTFIVQYAHVYIMQFAGQKKLRDIRLAVFAKLQQMPLAYFDRNSSGKIITMAVNDVNSLNEVLSQGFIGLIGDLVLIVGITAVLMWFDYRLTLLTFAAVVPLVYVTRLYRRKTRPVYRQIRANAAEVNSYVQENAAGMKTVQLFNRQEENHRRFDAVNKANRDEQLRSVMYAAVYFPLNELLYACSIGIVIWYGGGETLRGALQLGTLVAFIQYVQRFFTPLLDLADKYDLIQHALASLERIFEFLDASQPDDASAPVNAVTTLEGRVEFKNVWFAYGDGEPVLKGISFLLRPGESAAIVGATGAGKTSLINLIGRFYDTRQGEILIDGVDIKTMDKSFLRKQLGIVPQDAVLFAGTVEDNITLGDKSVTPETVRAAARQVGAQQFISQLPLGYKQPVRQSGGGLSLGQKQLIAFTRALVLDPQILILDEATSGVDEATERLIKDAMATIVKGRTSLIIAHRLSTIRQVNKIIVIDNGEIVEEGDHDALLRRRGIYYKLHQLQAEI